MKITLKAFAFYRDVLGSQTQLELSHGATIETLLEMLFTRHRELRPQVLTSEGRVKPLVIILKNGRNIVHLEGLHTKLDDQDMVSLFPPVAGG